MQNKGSAADSAPFIFFIISVALRLCVTARLQLNNMARFPACYPWQNFMIVYN